ncbi:MAG: TIGR03435 family protein [Acidobacteriota bacterium]|nr:TIGR03435 family protein [Acidobacteriota bacterium]
MGREGFPMTPGHWTRRTALLAGLTGALGAQPKSPAPAFDVVSIRRVPPDAPMLTRDVDFSPVLPGGRFIDERIPASVMIGFAYGVKNSDQITGLPGWAENTSYSIAAKAPDDFSAATEADNLAQVRLMMRAMLADRFHLEIQPETQNRKGLRLEVAKGGLKVREVSAPIPPAKEGLVFAAGRENGGGRILGTKSTMAGLARCLSFCLRQPVVDGTGLKGYYDFDLRWIGDSPDPGGDFGTVDFVAGALSTLRNAVGLSVTRTTVPVEFWKVTHIEPPGDN